MTKTSENDQQDKKGHKIPTDSFKTKLIGCGIIKGEMNESIWQKHARQRFSSVIDMNDLVRKDVRIEFDSRHVKLKSDDNPATKNLLIFRHKTKSILHGYNSIKFNYICYLCKISSSTYQFVVIEAGKHSGKFVNLIRGSKRRSSSTSGQLSLLVKESSDTSVVLKKQDTNNNKADEDEDEDKAASADIEVIDISSSESEQDAGSDIDIVEILPPVPFRNHTLTNIEDD